MYGWFGSKNGLFDAVLSRHLQRFVDAVPFTDGDLPGYAVALYDSYLTDPALVRLASWYRLERVPTGPLLAAHPGLNDPKHDAITRAQAEGLIIAGIAPEDIYALVIALAGTWSSVSATTTATSSDPDAEHERSRVSGTGRFCTKRAGNVRSGAVGHDVVQRFSTTLRVLRGQEVRAARARPPRSHWHPQGGCAGPAPVSSTTLRRRFY